MSSSSSSSDSAATSSFPVPVTNNNNGGQQNGTLYLFTFLITIIVLALISGALLFRAYYVRRRFQRRIEEALRSGQPLPTDAAVALGLIRPGRSNKKEKKVGPMPMIWESEMLLQKEKSASGGSGWDEERDIGAEKTGWEGLEPLSVVHYTDPLPPASDAESFNLPPDLFAPPPQRFEFLPNWLPQPRHPRRPVLERQLTKPIPKRECAYVVPEYGEEVEVSVMIAMPCEYPEEIGTVGRDGEGKRDMKEREERFWVREVDEEREVPDVVLGTMKARIS